MVDFFGRDELGDTNDLSTTDLLSLHARPLGLGDPDVLEGCDRSPYCTSTFGTHRSARSFNMPFLVRAELGQIAGVGSVARGPVQRNANTVMSSPRTSPIICATTPSMSRPNGSARRADR